MAALHAEQWSVPPAQRAAFVALLAESRAFWEPFGAEFRIRTSLVAGEGTGLITVYQFYPDPAARAVALDRGAAAADRDPLVLATHSGALPGTLVARQFLDSVDPAMPIPEEYPVAALTAYEVAPGRLEEAQAAFDAADARERALGVEPALWLTLYAGSTSGRRLRVLGHANYADQATFAQRNLDPRGAHPLTHAVADGVMRVVTMSITVPFMG